jgi:hypothetical protein
MSEMQRKIDLREATPLIFGLQAHSSDHIDPLLSEGCCSVAVVLYDCFQDLSWTRKNESSLQCLEKARYLA